MEMRSGYEILGVGAMCIVAGAIGSVATRYFINSDLKEEKSKLNDAIANAEKSSQNIAEQVDTAVRFVYDNEARGAFERKLRSVNVEEIAVNECKNSIRKVEDSVIRQSIRNSYDSQIRKVMQDELKEYFKTGIKRLVDTEIDTDFIRRTARDYVKNETNDILEKEISNEVGKCDVSQAVEEYIDDNSSKFDTLIRKEIKKVISEKFDDDFVDRVVEAVEDSLED